MTDFSQSGRAPGLARLLTLLASCTGGSSPRLTSAEDDPLLVSGCAGPAGADRWASGVSGYHAVRTFGQRVGEELVHPVGVAAAADGRSVLFDLGLPSVITFDSDLRETHRFGRSGQGPGEFDAVIPLRLNIAQESWVAASDSEIVTVSGGRVEQFSWGGDHRRSYTLRTGRLTLPRLILSVRGIWVADGEILLVAGFPLPWTGFSGAMVFRAGPDSLVAIDSVIGPPPPQEGGRMVSPSGQARSRVLVWGDCLLANDGASLTWHLRHLVTGVRDSVLLPSFGRRPPAPLSPEQVREREALTRAGGLSIRAPTVPPSALNRWRAAIVDPDGVLWLWPEKGDWEEGEGVEVIRVSLRTKRSAWDTVPAFPAAFTLPGEFVASHEDADTGIRFLTLYRNSGSTRIRVGHLRCVFGRGGRKAAMIFSFRYSSSR